jgi:Protein of unknown function (DUF1761)
MARFVLPIMLAAIVSFLIGGIWYGALFSDLYLRELAAADIAPSSSGAWQVLAEFARCLAVALVLWRLIAWTQVRRAIDALLLGIILWAGFQATAIAGSFVHEAYPWRLYLLHAGDALLKTIATALLLTSFHKRLERR